MNKIKLLLPVGMCFPLSFISAGCHKATNEKPPIVKQESTFEEKLSEEVDKAKQRLDNSEFIKYAKESPGGSLYPLMFKLLEFKGLEKILVEGSLKVKEDKPNAKRYSSTIKPLQELFDYVEAKNLGLKIRIDTPRRTEGLENVEYLVISVTEKFKNP